MRSSPWATARMSTWCARLLRQLGAGLGRACRCSVASGLGQAALDHGGQHDTICGRTSGRLDAWAVHLRGGCTPTVRMPCATWPPRPLRLLTRLHPADRRAARAQVHIRAYTEMESHEEKLANMIKASKISEAKEEMKRKVSQIDKDKAERRKAGGGDSSSMMMEGFGKMIDDSAASLAGTSMIGGTDYRPPEDYAKSAAASLPVKSVKAGGGMQLGKKNAKIDLMAAMASEGAIAPTAAPGARASAGPAVAGVAAAAVASGALQLNVEEKVVAVLGRDGGVQSLEVKGDLQLLVTNPAMGKLSVAVSFGENAGFQFKTHPNINKQLFAEQSILGLKDSGRSFPPGNALGVLKWRLQTTDSAMVPLTGERRGRGGAARSFRRRLCRRASSCARSRPPSAPPARWRLCPHAPFCTPRFAVNCWPSMAGDGTCEVSMEYELVRTAMELQNVSMTIPFPPGCGQPKVTCEAGEATYSARNNALVWNIPLINRSNSSGTLEFTVTGARGCGGRASAVWVPALCARVLSRCVVCAQCIHPSGISRCISHMPSPLLSRLLPTALLTHPMPARSSAARANPGAQAWKRTSCSPSRSTSPRPRPFARWRLARYSTSRRESPSRLRRSPRSRWSRTPSSERRRGGLGALYQRCRARVSRKPGLAAAAELRRGSAAHVVHSRGSTTVECRPAVSVTVSRQQGCT